MSKVALVRQKEKASVYLESALIAVRNGKQQAGSQNPIDPAASAPPVETSVHLYSSLRHELLSSDWLPNHFLGPSEEHERAGGVCA